ncbi:hypothetical protein L1887_35151 [Cichorium endivia]|nr:hypothetical protein L1887_35151 [Cichorium endivia]
MTSELFHHLLGSHNLESNNFNEYEDDDDDYGDDDHYHDHDDESVGSASDDMDCTYSDGETFDEQSLNVDPVTNHTFAYLRVELGDFATFIAIDILLEYVIGGAVVARSWTSHFVTLCNYKPKDFWITTHGLTKNYNELDPIIIIVLSAKGFSLINYIASVIHIIVILFIIICSLINADTKKGCETLPYEACGIFEAFIVLFFSYVGLICCCVGGGDKESGEEYSD